jgi:hypothetical protein
LYAELVEQYSTGLPSDANLKYDLIQRGFIPGGAESALNCFKQSVNFAAYFEHQAARALAAVEDDVPTELVDSEEPIESHILPAVAAVTQAKRNPQVISEDEAQDRIPIRLPGGRKAWLLIPTPFYEADKIRLKAQIDLLLAEDE